MISYSAKRKSDGRVIYWEEQEGKLCAFMISYVTTSFTSYTTKDYLVPVPVWNDVEYGEKLA